jgi:hypothetical protein
MSLGALVPAAAVGRARARTHCGVIRVAYDTGGHGRYRVIKKHTTCRRAKRVIRNFYGGRQHYIPGAGAEYNNPHAVRGGWRCGVFAGGVGCFKRHHRRPKPVVTAILQY